MPRGQGQKYKIKLTSGRILGPIDLERVRLLISKNQIQGTETARVYPQGEWKDFNQIPELGQLIVERVQKDLDLSRVSTSLPDTRVISSDVATTVLPSPMLPGAAQVLYTGSLQLLPEELAPQTEQIQKNSNTEVKIDLDRSHQSDLPDLPGRTHQSNLPDNDRTEIAKPSQGSDNDEDRTRVEEHGIDSQNHVSESGNIELYTRGSNQYELEQHSDLSEQKTVVFQRSTSDSRLPGKKRGFKTKELIRAICLSLLLGYFGYDSFLAEPEKKPPTRQEPIRPKLPLYKKGKTDPNKSMQIYNDAIRKFYLQDTVQGYRLAAEKLNQAAAEDVSNVKALAMLASSYINLIDSSNKDENYFSVLSKLIDMSRAKAVDLPETVIADVEFYLIVNKAEAAQNRIVEYTKTHPSFGLEMFYYLSLAFFERGDAASAARFIGQFPDNKVYSAKIFYLRGQVAEKLNDLEAAFREYQKAVQFNPDHAKSRLRIAYLLNKQGNLREAATHLSYLMNHVNLLAPRDLGLAYYLHGLLAELFQKWDMALGDIERAVRLDPENHDYLLEMYTLRAKAGDSLQAAQKQARMYYFLGEGEKLVQEGKYQEALVPFLQARQANDESPIPLVKMGDMFDYLKDVENAKVNYKLAADRAPSTISIWSKYIKTLIESYEWEEAKKAMDKFRKLPVSQSAIDKAAADMYQKQGRFVEAQTFYRKAMARDLIDSEVYIAYGKSLMSTRNFKDAPFFFALGLRFDPLNIDAIISTAKCVAETESLERAINMLQDEVKRGTRGRAEFLAAIAELQIQKGAWEQAQQNVDQAMKANPDYAYPWKLQAQIYMNQEGLEKDALDKALAAYKSYSERNTSDPSGYLERYKIFIKKTEFEKARDELTRIYTIYPKYPNLHYYLGALYAVQGNHKAAAEEFKFELSNNPSSVQTLIGYGRELLELEQPQAALTQFTKAMQLAPQSSEAKQNAGWANYYLKNFQAAVTLIRAALVLDRANPILHKRLGTVYRDMGDMGSACASFKKYLEIEPDAQDKAQFQGCL